MPMFYSKTCDNKCKYNEFWNKILEDFLPKLETLKLLSATPEKQHEHATMICWRATRHACDEFDVVSMEHSK